MLVWFRNAPPVGPAPLRASIAYAVAFEREIPYTVVQNLVYMYVDSGLAVHMQKNSHASLYADCVGLRNVNYRLTAHASLVVNEYS